MRILLALHHALDPNQGAPGATLQLGAALGVAGHEVDYLSWDDMPARVSSRTKELFFPEFVARELRRRERERPYDVVDGATGDLWIWGALARRRRGRRPLIVTRAHGLEHRFSQALLREARAGGDDIGLASRVYHHGARLREVAASLRVADLCLFMNEGDRDYAVGRLGVAPERTHLIANGLPSEFIGLPFDPLPPDAPVRIAHVGSFHPRKGVRYGVPALDAVLSRRPEVRASWIGSSAPAADVLAGFDPAVRDRVDVVESFEHERLPEFLAGHHVDLFPSLAEGFSLALIEAMACGLAPVATRETAAGIVTDGESGLLVPAFDSGAIERALDELVGDRVRLERLRAAAHESAQRYTWERAARDTLAIYERQLVRQ